MKTNVLLICILICHVFAACSTKNNSSNVSTIELNPDYEKNSFVFEDVFKTVKSIPLETNSNSIIGGVSKLIESNRSLFIMDDKNNKIVRFDLQGKYLNSIGTSGHGPGEFLKVKDFSIDDTNQQVSVYDVRGRKIIIYNFEGFFIYEFSIDFFLNSIAIDDSGNYYGFTGSISNRSHADSEVLNKLKFIKFDNNGNVIKNITAHNNPEIGLNMYEHISCQSDGTISFTEPLHNAIFKLNDDIVEPHYIIDFKNYFVPDNIKEQLNLKADLQPQANRDFFQEANKNHILGLLMFHENEDWIVIQYMINYKSQFAFFHKKSEKLFESSSLPASLKTKSTFFTPKHIDNNYIYSAQTTFYLHERYNQDKNDKKTSEARIKDWESFIQKVNIDDNPVIFRYEFAKDIY